MVLDFREALFAAGALLFLIGVLTEAAYLASGAGGTEFSDLFSYGMNSTIFAFFSGVLIGAGFALVADSALSGMKRCAARLAFLTLLTATMLCIAVVAFSQNGADQQIIYLIVFFASLAAFLAFTLSIIVTIACVFGRKLVSEGETDETCAKGGKRK
jgi:hypothetical protein